MSRRIVACLLSTILLLTVSFAQAQQPKKVPRIGYLSATDPAGEATRSEAIQQALRELGHIEGQNIAIEYRYTQGKVDRAPELAAELVRLKVDIIVVSGGPYGSGRPRMRPRRFPSLCWARGPILLRKASLKGLRVPVATLPALHSWWRTRREAAGAAQRSRSQTCPCRRALQSGRSGRSISGERSSPRRSACPRVDF